MKKLFENERFKPDMLKIYPTLVVGGTVLHKWAEEGRYTPYSSEDAADVISEFYRHIPEYVRVMRIQRDIPAGKIGSGVKKSNLRELVEQKIREKSIAPKEIRYREVKAKPSDLSKFSMNRFEYDASDGKEIFLSYENEDRLLAGFLRLRFPGESTRPDVDNETALVRELHVYGSEVPISSRGTIQHKGIGSKLLAEAETMAKEAGRKRISIISGVGVREYYARHGYNLSGPYMTRI